jgi:hypothetical protein
MIIVKTKNGDRFINDKAVTMVEHDREKAVVHVHGDKGMFFRIEDVEGIIYNNDAQPIHWKDEGSEIQRLKKANEELSEWGGRMRDEYLKIEQERDELKARVAQLEPKADHDRWSPDNVDVTPVNVIIGHIEKTRRSMGYGVRLSKIFEANDIKTVGDLLRVGRHKFRTYNSVGNGSVTRIDDALEELYNIMSW